MSVMAVNCCVTVHARTPAINRKKACCNFFAGIFEVCTISVMLDWGAELPVCMLHPACVLQFLTNIFFVPYMALRQQPPGSRGTTDKPGKAQLPGYAPAIGWTGAIIGIGSVIWALAVRPEYGGLGARWQYAVEQTLDNRVFFAFVLDAVMYAAWQAILMDKDAPKSQRYVPFVGLASYLIKGGGR